MKQITSIILLLLLASAASSRAAEAVTIFSLDRHIRELGEQLKPQIEHAKLMLELSKLLTNSSAVPAATATKPPLPVDLGPKLQPLEKRQQEVKELITKLAAESEVRHKQLTNANHKTETISQALQTQLDVQSKTFQGIAVQLKAVETQSAKTQSIVSDQTTMLDAMRKRGEEQTERLKHLESEVVDLKKALVKAKEEVSPHGPFAALFGAGGLAGLVALYRSWGPSRAQQEISKLWDEIDKHGKDIVKLTK